MNEKSSTYVSKIQTPHQFGKRERGGFHCEKCGQDWLHEPKSKCPGMTVYGWGRWPATLLTFRQFQELDYDLTLLTTPQGCASFNARKKWLWLYSPPIRQVDIVDAETGQSMLEVMLNEQLANLFEFADQRSIGEEDLFLTVQKLKQQITTFSQQNISETERKMERAKVKRVLIKNLLEDLATRGSHDTCTRAEFEQERVKHESK